MNFYQATTCYVLSLLLTLFSANTLEANSSDKKAKNAQKTDVAKMMERFNRSMDKDFKEMMKNIRAFSNQMRGFSFDYSFNTAQGPISVKKHNDEKNTYLEIDLSKIDKDALQLEIKNGKINLEMNSKKVVKKKSAHGESTSVQNFQFSESYALPEGVKESDIKIDKKGRKVVITIPIKKTAKQKRPKDLI